MNRFNVSLDTPCTSKNIFNQKGYVSELRIVKVNVSCFEYICPIIIRLHLTCSNTLSIMPKNILIRIFPKLLCINQKAKYEYYWIRETKFFWLQFIGSDFVGLKKKFFFSTTADFWFSNWRMICVCISKTRRGWYLTESMIGTDYADDLALLIITPALVLSLMHNLKPTARNIDLWM